MEPLEFAYDRLLMWFDRGVFELFSLPTDYRAEPPFRVPVRWLAVRLDFTHGKPDRGRLRFHRVASPDQPLYQLGGPRLPFTHQPAARIRLADEPLFREYFAQVALRADRAVAD